MKNYFYVLFGLLPFLLSAQCDFDVFTFNNEKVNATSKQMFILQENEKAQIADYLLFSLFTDGSQKEILTTFSRVTKNQLQSICFDTNTRLKFILKKGEAVELYYLGKKEYCEDQKKHPVRKEFNTVKLQGSFGLDKASFKSLKKNTVESVSIITKGGVYFNYKVQTVLEDKYLGIKTYPASFFVNNLPCLEF